MEQIPRKGMGKGEEDWDVDGKTVGRQTWEEWERTGEQEGNIEGIGWRLSIGKAVQVRSKKRNKLKTSGTMANISRQKEQHLESSIYER